MRYLKNRVGLGRLATLLGGLATLGLLQVNGANLLPNGDFENPIVGNGGAFYNVNAPLPGWTTSSQQVGVYNTASGLGVMGGEQTLFLTTAGSGISGTATQATTPGLQYTLSWLAGNLADGVTYAYSVKVEQGGAGIVASATYQSDNNGVSSPLGKSINFIAANNAVPLKVTFTRLVGFNANFVALDDIVLTPEPQTYALAAGLGLIAFAGYRRFRG